MRTSVKYALIGMGSLAALVAVIVILAVFLPESPKEIEHLGAFDVYRFHYSNIGEPGHSRKELWYRGKRLARDPAIASLSPAGDRIIFVNAMDSPPGVPAPKGNGIYYFDSRNQKKYLLVSGKFPDFYNGEIGLGVANVVQKSNSTPWAPDGSFAVVSYGDSPGLPKAVLENGQAVLRDDTERVLLVNLTTGEVRSAADLFNVSDQAHVIFRGWSGDKSTLLFRVNGEERMLPISAVEKK
jgi:hypothetical protein